MRHGRLHHALLLTGRTRALRRSAALALSALILCRSPRLSADSPSACGECPECLRFQKGLNPDFIHVRPEGASIRIDQIRQVQSQLSFRPLNQRARVLLLEDAEAMTPEGANAFLKTLEEPPEMNYLILTACSSALLLDTIVSRCQELRLTAGGLPVPGGAKELKEERGEEQGPMLDRLTEFLSSPQRVKGLFALSSWISEDRERAAAALQAMERLVRDMLFIQLSGESAGPCGDKAALAPAGGLYELARRINCDRLTAYLDEISRLSFMLDRNVNRQLIALRLLLFWLDEGGKAMVGLKGSGSVRA